MKKLSRSEVGAFLRDGDHFGILTHRRPDGDTLGSAAALCRGLRAMGKRAWILPNPEITPKFIPMHDGLTCEGYREGMTLVCVDTSAVDMLPKEYQPLADRISLIIDHHGSNKKFAPRGIVDSGAAACGEIIYDLLREMGVPMDRETAEAIYVAISTDTGCFRYSNTTAHTLRTAAACMEAGARTHDINFQLFELQRLSRLKLNAYLAQHLELYQEGTIALCPIPKQAEIDCGVVEDDMDSVSNFARNVEGVKLSVTFREERPGVTKISARCADGYNVAKVCIALGGGGHIFAAGASVPYDMQTTRRKVLEVLREQGYLKEEEFAVSKKE